MTEKSRPLEYTPTWVVSAICSIIVFISFCAERGLHHLGKLVRELRKGCTFDGWSEGTLNFPPTYKYELNSEKYVGEDPKVGRRTPAWCDRVLSMGKGLRLLSYRRSEFLFSDHRPVTALYMVEVEEFCPRKLQKALTFTDAEIEDEEIGGGISSL